jgi:2-methylisocitrate lyase-like PEP mutase family enzyme
MTTQEQKCRQLADLHQGPVAFIIANPWDAGSARLLEGLGFKALATTSAGFAFTLARGDGQPSLEDKLAHCRAVAEATALPVNADFEDGFSDDPRTVADHVRRVAETGIAGCSIEDFSRIGKRVFEQGQAVERVQAAAEAVAGLGIPFQLTARAETLLRGDYDLDGVVDRMQAFSKAGAHVLYAPGVRSLDDLKQVTAAVDKPFNVLAPFLPDATVADFAAAGARRISLGGALTWAALAPVIAAGREMTERGSFTWMAGAASGREIAKLMGG